MFKWQSLRYYAGVFGFLLLLMWTWGYVILLKSESYAFANGYLKSNPNVIARLGEIESSRPGYSNFKQSYAAGVWKEYFNVVLKGKKESGVAFINLESTSEGWKINSATLEAEGQNTDLMSPAPSQ